MIGDDCLLWSAAEGRRVKISILLRRYGRITGKFVPARRNDHTLAVRNGGDVREASADDRLDFNWNAKPVDDRNPDYLHCPLFLRASIACRHHDAQPQPEVAHFFVHALVQALTSQLTPAASAGPGITAIDSP